MTGLLRRVRGEPLLVDVFLAVSLTALSLVQLLAGARDIGSYAPMSIALLLLQSIPLVARSRFPMAVLAISAGATVAHGLFAGDSLRSSLAAFFALYTVAERYERRLSFPWAAVLATAFAGLIAWRGGLPAGLGGLVQTVLATGVAWLLGAWSRERRQYIGTVEQRAQRAEQEREERAARAVTAERERIARELHDVVTHHVSVIVIQAGAALRAFDRRPGDARSALEAIDDAGRRALADMRRLLGIVRPSAADGEALEPMPGLDRLGELIESVRSAGVPVELSVVGERRQLDPGVELSAYRIVQEALTNTLKYAHGAKAQVTVRYDPSTLEVRVQDAGGAGPSGIAAAGEGRGLVGMRERVAIFGGEFQAGPGPDGFRVLARLPLGVDAGGATS